MEDPAPWRARLIRMAPRMWGVLAFFALLCLLLSMQRRVSPQLDFADDAAYLDLVSARTWSSVGHPGLGPATPIPATSGVLWQALLFMGLKTSLPPLAAPCALAALLGVVLLLKTWRIAGLMNVGRWAVAAVLLVAVASSLPMDVIGGRSHVLGAVLTLLMVQGHLETAPRDRWPMPLSSACWAGLAVLLHVELLVIWLALGLHAIATGHLRHGNGAGLVFPTLRLLSGLIIVGLMLTPVLAWNMKTLGVPWPRFPDAPLSLDIWATQAPGVAFARTLDQSFSVLIPCYLRAFSVPVLAGFVPVIFLFIGLAATLEKARLEPFQILGTVGFALLLVPLLYALIYPYVGWSAAAPVFSALQPVWAVLIVAGVARTADALCRYVEKSGQRDMAWLSPGWASAVLLTLLIALGCLLNLHRGGRHSRLLAVEKAARLQLLDELGPTRPDEYLASDRVGWLAYVRAGRYLDLTGARYPLILSIRATDGWQPAQDAAYLREQKVTAVISWTQDYGYLATHLGCASDTPLPRLCRVN